MTDPLKARLEKIQKFSDTAKRRTDFYTDIAKMDDGAGIAGSLRCLQKAPAPGKKLQKIGFLMLWIPEPTMITTVLGGPLIVAGRFMEKKYNSSTIHDIGHETKSNLSTISDFKNSIS